VDAEVRELIAHMARVNLLWGAPRIHGELLKVGFKVFGRRSAWLAVPRTATPRARTR
jgi:hypothetical protein